ncbi:MAG: hypothetical protein N2515_02180 [Deltaproteobacteria bacterium]|nr:hypothetical protein [Sandaracinaceae bacterium]MCX7807392.1 hypothetical protein [Deltaproteobacteria bacterium]MDW8246257.1 hypothetical protein [Sandaracinaceae bacterium]
MDLIGPDVFVNASVAPGTPPDQVAQRLLGKPGAKPKSTPWVLQWVEAMLSKTPSFKQENVKPHMELIRSLVDVVEVNIQESDWLKGLVASAKAVGAKRVITDHPDLADQVEVEGIQFVSTEAWLVEASTPPPPPPKR